MGENITIHIDSMAYGGAGIGRVDGKTFFIPFTVEGDVAEIEIISEKKRFSTGSLISIIEPSVYRAEPFCPHFGTCGGCQYQHIQYKIQTELKKIILGDVLQRIGKVIPGLESTIPSPKETGYRNSVRFQVSPRGEIGFYETKTHNVIPIRECPLVVPEINKRLRECTAVFGKERPCPERIDMFVSEDGKLTERLQYPGENRPLPFHQVNHDVNGFLRKKLFDTVRATSDGSNIGNVRILDLYCGGANLSGQFASPDFSPPLELLIGIDSNREAIQAASQYATEHPPRERYPNIEFICGDVRSVLQGQKKGKQATQSTHSALQPAQPNSHPASGHQIFNSAAARGFTHIIIDPPRQGIKSIINPIAALEAPAIIYISCSPPHLARDIASLQEAGYELDSVTPLDMFPQTSHIEALAVFRAGFLHNI